LHCRIFFTPPLDLFHPQPIHVQAGTGGSDARASAQASAVLVPLEAQVTFYAGASGRAAADIMNDVAKAKAAQLNTYAKYKDLASVRGVVVW
jgi:hypothetical protein